MILSQRSLASGEISPSLYARVDMSKYQTGLRTMKNSLILRHGGSANRPGTTFIAPAKFSTRQCRLIPFDPGNGTTFILEFGHNYMRVLKNGAPLVRFNSITSVTVASQFVFSVPDSINNPPDGGTVTLINMKGMTALDGVTAYVVAIGVVGGQYKFYLKNEAGTYYGDASSPAFVSGFYLTPYEIQTPYPEDELRDLQYVQSVDVLKIVHPSHPLQRLSHFSDFNWTLADDVGSTAAEPYGVSVSGGAGGSLNLTYVVTALNKDSGEESIVGKGGSSYSITGIAGTNPLQISWTTSTAYAPGDPVVVVFSGAMASLNYKTYTIISRSGSTATISADGSPFGANCSGTIVPRVAVTAGVAFPTATSPINLTWGMFISDTSQYEFNIYRKVNDAFGFIGTSATTKFNDIGYTPDQSDGPPSFADVLNKPDNYASAITLYQQRQIVANTNAEPEKIFCSQTGSYNNYSMSRPIKDDDAIIFNMAGRQVNPVKHLLDLGALIVFTATGEWGILGDDAGILRPSAINPKQQSYNGASKLSPIVIDNTALYVQARGSIVRDLGYEASSDGYKGNDLTAFSTHLFDGYQMLDWTYQKTPHSNVWMVRDDGKLLGLTYVREHAIWGWHRHETDGKYESVASVPEGNEDAVYFATQRLINGAYVRMIERAASRQVLDIKDYIGMDCASSYDGTAITPDGFDPISVTLTSPDTGAWTTDDLITLTLSLPFPSTDPSDMALYNDKQIFVTGPDGNTLRMKIATVVSTAVIKCYPVRTVPVDMRGVAMYYGYALATHLIAGLTHLEGKQVSVLGDGFVVASPLNPSYQPVMVVGGVATFDNYYVKVHVGLPFIADLETLDIDMPNPGQALANRKMMVGTVSLQVEKSRGGWIGARPPTDDSVDALESLVEISQLQYTTSDKNLPLVSDKITETIPTEWNSNGRVFLRQVDPLPISVLAIFPEGQFPFAGTGGNS